MTISLPDTLKAFVEDQAGARGYGNSSEYVRELICRERDRQSLRSMILEGAASPLAVTADADFFDGVRKPIRRTAGKRARPEAPT